MFDQIGRINDETPLVVERFIKHAIEVWSVNEYEQRIGNHVDKLMITYDFGKTTVKVRKRQPV